ncbi:MAG: CPBP family intramembrane glutamate endopeptidase, partial [Chloroflexota bacterium]|nr:CPBP family intramembrane glutamate endopeptidase [Chloroflexota bacterium]
MRTTPLCLTYLAAIAAAEALAAVVGPLWGVAFHFIILFLIISNSALVGKNPSYRLLLALGLAPLIRILGLSMPLLEFSQIYWYLFISIPLVAGIFTVIRALDLSPQEVGLTRGSILVQGLIALTGIIFGLVEYYILKPEPLILSLGWQELVVPALILLVATGFVEELAFR